LTIQEKAILAALIVVALLAAIFGMGQQAQQEKERIAQEQAKQEQEQAKVALFQQIIAELQEAGVPKEVAEILAEHVVGNEKPKITVSEAVELYKVHPHLSLEAWKGLWRLATAKHSPTIMLDPAKREWPWDDLLRGYVWIGMTKEQARIAWGPPDEINRTITAGRVIEQWVYKPIFWPYIGKFNFLYFEDGILTAIQN